MYGEQPLSVNVCCFCVISSHFAACPGAFRQVGICHTSRASFIASMLYAKRSCVSVTSVLPPSHFDATVMTGTPGCVTKLAMILSTGFFETRVCVFQKSSELAFP